MPEQDAVSAHLAYLRWMHYSPSTISQRGYALGRFSRLLGRAVLDASPNEIMAFLGRLANAQTKKTERSHLQGFYRWAVVHGLRVDDPTLHVPVPRCPAGMPHPIAEHDLMTAISRASDRVRPWLFLAAFAGLRAAEIAALRGEDLWWHMDPPLIAVEHGKGDVADTVPIAPLLANELRPLSRRGWLFTRRDGKPGPVKPHTVSHLANDHLHSLGITLTLHSLRHRFGTQVYRASGRDLRQTQELMRHRSIASTLVYTAVDKAEAAGIVALLPAVVAVVG